MTKIKWADPPADGRGRRRSTHWAEVADALRANPGKWALVAESASPSTAQNIKRGTYVAFADEGFEAVSRKSPTGKGSDIYARFVGGESA